MNTERRLGPWFMVSLAALLWCLIWLGCTAAFAQQFQGPPIQGTAVNRSTLITPVVITAGNTFQQVLPSLVGTQTVRQALEIQNNNAADSCWLFLGPTVSATKATAILLASGQAYTRYFPYVPSDAIQATCATTADTLYVGNQ